jgi:molybdate transport system ATP-binding protein
VGDPQAFRLGQVSSLAAMAALNILSTTIPALRTGDGPGATVQLQMGKDLVLARVIRRSAEHFGLAVGGPEFAVPKSPVLAAGDIGALPAAGPDLPG